MPQLTGKKYCYNKTKIPNYIILDGRQIKVLNNLSIEPAGAYLVCRDLIADEINKCQKDCDIAVNCFYKIENITDYIPKWDDGGD